MLALFEELGLTVIRFFEYLGGIARLLVEAVAWMARGYVRPSLTMEQMAILGVSSIGIVVITTTFAGMVLSLQLTEYAVRYGFKEYVGGGVALAMAREFAPMLTAVVVAGRAGSAITAEIGSMKVTEQIEALRAMAVSPARYLVVPRLLAMIAMMPILATMSGVGGTLGGAFVAYTHNGVQYKTFFDSVRYIIVPWDVTSGLLKSAVFAVEIAMVACYQGLITGGGAAGVGRSTTNSVVNGMLVVFVTNYFLSAWMYPEV